jgi:hypothetical protein
MAMAPDTFAGFDANEGYIARQEIDFAVPDDQNIRLGIGFHGRHVQCAPPRKTVTPDRPDSPEAGDFDLRVTCLAGTMVNAPWRATSSIVTTSCIVKKMQTFCAFPMAKKW